MTRPSPRAQLSGAHSPIAPSHIQPTRGERLLDCPRRMGTPAGIFVNRTAGSLLRWCCALSMVLLAACNKAPAPAGPGPQGSVSGAGEALQIFKTPLPQQKSTWSWVGETPDVIKAADIGSKIKAALVFGPAVWRPSVIVFPVVDERNEVRHDGIGLWYQAQLAATYTPQRRLANSPRRVYEVFEGAGLAREGARLTPELIEGCLKSLDARMYAVCSLVPAGKSRELRIRFHGDGLAAQDATFSHPIGTGTLSQVPGLVTGDLLRHLKIDLSPKDHEWIAAQQLDADEANTLLGGFLTRDVPFGEVRRTSGERDDMAVRRFVLGHPRSLAAWEIYVNIEVVDQFFRPFELEPSFAHPMLDLAMARRVLSASRPAEALALLVKHAPMLNGDYEFHRLLTTCAARANELQRVEESLAVWRQADPGHSGCVRRGRWYMDRATELGFSAPVEQKLAATRPWLESARTELERAAELFPGGWEAPTHLISVATGLDLSREFVDRQFAAATQLVPANRSAYRRKLQYLLTRVPADPEQIFEFAEACARTGFWRQGIPQLVQEAVEGAGQDPQSRTKDFSVYRSERMWAALKAYYDGAQRNAWYADRQKATNTYTFCGVLGGHDSEVAALLRTMQEEASPEMYDAMVIGSPFQFMHLVDLATFHTDAGVLRDLAGARLALAEGKLDEAERLLRLVEAGTAGAGESPYAVSQTIDSTRQAVVYGRRLISSRSAAYSADDLAQFMMSQLDTSSNQGLTVRHTHWRTDGKYLVWDNTGTRGLPDSNLYFPIGIQHGVISGTIEVSGSVRSASVYLHTRAARDEVVLTYDTEGDHDVTVVRGRAMLMDLPCPSGPWKFRFKFGANEDRIEPLPGKTVLAKVVNDVPSAIAFNVFTSSGAPGTFKLSDLKIELEE